MPGQPRRRSQVRIRSCAPWSGSEVVSRAPSGSCSLPVHAALISVSRIARQWLVGCALDCFRLNSFVPFVRHAVSADALFWSFPSKSEAGSSLSAAGSGRGGYQTDPIQALSFLCTLFRFLDLSICIAMRPTYTSRLPPRVAQGSSIARKHAPRPLSACA